MPKFPFAQAAIQSSANSLLSVQTGLALWLDADNDASFSVDSFTGRVNQWTSREGNQRVFSSVQPGQVAQSIRTTRQNAWKTGRRIVTIAQNSNSGLYCPAFDIASLFAANGKDHTAFFVYRTDEKVQGSAGAVSPLFYHYISGATGHYFRFNQSDGNVFYLNASSSQYLTGSNTNYVGGENILCLKRSLDQLTSYVNGKQEATAASTATAIPAGSNASMYLGCSTIFGGQSSLDLGEILMYNRALTDVERYAVENYLATKWLQGVN